MEFALVSSKRLKSEIGVKKRRRKLAGAGKILNQPKMTRTKLPAIEPMESLDAKLFADAFSAGLLLPETLDPDFEDALRHVLDNPGSLIRPRLVYQMATAYGLDTFHAQELAVALEYFHTASLLFDDLPCMDNALERRGAPCTHLVFGEEGAILTALALINRAYALTWQAVSGCPQHRQARALAFIERSLGVDGVLNGQSLDLHYSRLPYTRQTTEHIARGKTVSLIHLTLALPAMLGGASARELQQIERISVFWGLGYQIVDDLKDVLQSAAQTGKTPDRDALLGHPNIASVMGIRGAVQRLTRFIDLGDRVLRSLLTSRPELDFLERLRGELQQELARVTRNSCALAERVTP
jgi:geranylgeranyl diphosphate synthase, type II